MFKGLITFAFILLPSVSWAALTSTPTSWTNFTFTDYKWGGKVVYDHESSQDPSHGKANGVAPASVDIASCSADGSLPGTKASTQIALYNGGTEQWIAFRMRLNDTPIERANGATGYISRIWNFLIDVDGDGYKEYVVSVDGTFAATNDDRLYIYYNDSNTQEIADGDRINEFVASSSNAKSHTRVVEDTSTTCQGKYEYWIDAQVPLSAFTGAKPITAASKIRVFMSTSTTKEDPLLKDWMESMCTGDPMGSSFDLTNPIKFGSSFDIATRALETENGSLSMRVYKDVNGDMLLNKGDASVSLVASYVVKNTSGTAVSTIADTGLLIGTGTGYTYNYKDLTLPVGTYFIDATTADTSQSYIKSMPTPAEVGICGTTNVDVPVGPFGIGNGNAKFYFFAYQDLDGNGAFDKATENLFPTGTNLELWVNRTSGGGGADCLFAADGAGAPDPAACVYVNSSANKKTFYIQGTYTGWVPTSPLTISKEMTNKTKGGYFAFGFAKAGKISGVVFNDLNGDGYRNLNEPGISGVSIDLTKPDGSHLAATTDSNGYYEFTGSTAGIYYITETDPIGYTSTTPNTISVNYAAGGNISANFADITSGKIRGYSFSDLNGDSRLQTVEPRISDVLISLFDENGLLYASTRTDSNGTYSFDVVPGGYKVVQSTPSGYKATTPTSVSVYVPASGGATAVFGNLPYGTIVNYAFEDKNANGTPDQGEQGLSGLALSLTSSGGYSGSLTSANDGVAGYYMLSPSTYTGTGPTLTSYTATTPLSSVYALAAADAKVNFFGYILSGSIAGTVFFDINQNGVRDTGEPGVNGVTITITGGSTVTTTTDFTGAYIASGLSAATYNVAVTNPSGYFGTTASSKSVVLTNGGSGSASFGITNTGIVSGQVRLDSDNNGVFASTDSPLPGVRIDLSDATYTITDTNGNYSFVNRTLGPYTVTATVPTGYYSVGATTSTVTLTASANGRADFLMNGTSRISGTLFKDENANSIFDTGDTVIDSVTVGLSNSSTANTDVDGLYSFTGLTPGSYTVTAPAVTGYVASSSPTTVTLAARSSQTVNFAYVPSNGTITGRVRVDIDDSGTLGAGDTALAGVVVSLSDSTSTTTDASGNFSFSNKALGTYTVTVTVPSGYYNVTSTSASVTLTALSNSGTADFLLNGTGAISGMLFKDENSNSVYDAGDIVIGSVTVNLSNSSTASTDAGGLYSFTGLNPGSYTVTAPAVAGYSASTSPTTVTVAARSTQTVNFAYAPSTGTITGRVRVDIDDSGTLGAGDTALAGVVVSLSDSTSTTTDASGNFSFSNKPFGTYTVTATVPSGYYAVTSSSASVTISAMSRSGTADFLFNGTGTISGMLFKDENSNSVYDAGDTVIGSVTVNLSNSSTASTSAGGLYSFTGLTPGSYTVTAPGVVGYTVSTSPTTVTVAARSTQTVNFAYQPITGTISGRVRIDTDDSGTLGAGDTALAGVVVSLSDSTSTTTDASGNFSFANKPLGVYVVTATVPAGYYAVSTMSATVTLSVLATSGTADFLINGTSSISGTLFKDENSNGVYDAGDTYINSVTVGLSNSSTANTDASGQYSFTGLTPATYTVTPPAVSGYTPSVASRSVTLAARSTATANFAYTPNANPPTTGSISGQVKVDTDNSGTFGAPDTALAGVRIDLSDGTFTTTDASGNYSFASKAFGTYTVTATVPAGYYAVGAISSSVTVSISVNGSANFLVNGTGTISGTLFKDENSNGVYDAGDTLIDAVSVGLSNSSTATTDTNGQYSFSGLQGGTYTVTPPSVTGYRPTATTKSVTLAPRSSATADFAYRKINPYEGIATSVKVTGSGSMDFELLIAAMLGMAALINRPSRRRDH